MKSQFGIKFYLDKLYFKIYPIIHVKDLTFTYAQIETPSVRGFDFDIQNGEIFSFLGPSGAG